MAEKILTYREKQRASSPEVLWYWGATGTGKSRAAAADAAERGHGLDDVFWHPGGKWWDGYDRQAVVILDDFRPGNWKFAYLLRVLDRYPMRVEVKGGFRQLDSPLIIISCPKHPAECYLDSGEDLEQLLRRITTIREFEL